MIAVKKINQEDIIVNCELIETIEFSPHAVITLVSGHKLIIADGREEIMRKVLEYKRSINGRPVDIQSLRTYNENT